MLALTAPVQAAEITPDSTSYSYGSTSEIAPSAAITTSSSSGSSTLASTGDPANIAIAVAVALLFLGTTSIIVQILRKKSFTR